MNPMRRAAILCVALVLAGCEAGATRTVSTTEVLSSSQATVGSRESPRILVMQPDVKFYLMTMSGLPQAQAEWTEAAQRNILEAAVAAAASRDADLVAMPEDHVMHSEDLALERLHSAVGATIQMSYYGYAKLPTKGEAFDWSLGPTVQHLGNDFDADYALFMHYRDYRASGGRMAFAILAAAAGVAVSTGGQGGFASLVDLRTGEVVWFNQVDFGAGDLRTPEGARKTVEVIFRDMPTG